MSKPVHSLTVTGGRRARLRDKSRRTRPAPSDIGADLLTHQQPGDKPLSKNKRNHMKLALARNRWRRRRHEVEVEQNIATGACLHCGARPCGHLWDVDKHGEHSTTCCTDCTHDNMPGWRHTHTVFLEGTSYPTMGVAGADSDDVDATGYVAMIFFRADGVVNWTLGTDGFKRHLGAVQERAVVYTAEAVARDDELQEQHEADMQRQGD